jgi:hypothetical protein
VWRPLRFCAELIRAALKGHDEHWRNGKVRGLEPSAASG